MGLSRRPTDIWNGRVVRQPRQCKLIDFRNFKGFILLKIILNVNNIFFGTIYGELKIKFSDAQIRSYIRFLNIQDLEKM